MRCAEERANAARFLRIRRASFFNNHPRTHTHTAHIHPPCICTQETVCRTRKTRRMRCCRVPKGVFWSSGEHAPHRCKQPGKAWRRRDQGIMYNQHAASFLRNPLSPSVCLYTRLTHMCACATHSPPARFSRSFSMLLLGNASPEEGEKTGGVRSFSVVRVAYT